MEVPQWFRRRLHDYARSHGKPDVNGKAGLICLWSRTRNRFGVLEYNPLKRSYEFCFYLQNPETYQIRDPGQWVFDKLDARDTRKRFATPEQFIEHYIDQDERNRQSEIANADAEWTEERRKDLEKEVHFIHNHGLTDGSSAELLTHTGVKKNHAAMPANTPAFAPTPSPEAAHVSDTHAA